MKENAQRIKLVLEDLSPYTKSRTCYYCANVQAILKPSKFCFKDLLTYMHYITSDMAQPCTYVHTGNLLIAPFTAGTSPTQPNCKRQRHSVVGPHGGLCLLVMSIWDGLRDLSWPPAVKGLHIYLHHLSNSSHLQWKLFRGKTNQHSFKQPVPYLLNPLVVSSHFCWDSWITSTKMLATSKGLKLHIKRNVQQVQYIKICLSKVSRIIKRPLVTLHKLKQAWKQQSCWE